MNLPWPVRALLWPFSVLYGWGARLRALLYEKGIFERNRLKASVISVGNLTLGGTGKTPTVMYLAKKLIAEGKRVAVLTRGYRGSAGTSDEVRLMRKRLGDHICFGIGADRFAEGQKLLAKGPIDFFLLDDGFQHLALERDVDILMLDGSINLEHEWLLPAGTLREPIGACSRADIIVVTRQHGQCIASSKLAGHKHIFYSHTRLLGLRKLGESSDLPFVDPASEAPFLAFCGIGSPQGFFSDLKSWSIPVVKTRAFRDHHRYTDLDVKKLEIAARKAGARRLVTTEKDEQNLNDREFSMPVFVAVIDMVLPSENEFAATLNRILTVRRKST